MNLLTGIVGAALLLWGQESPAEPPPPVDVPPSEEQIRLDREIRRRQEQVEEGIRWLLDADPELQEMGRCRLMEHPPEAVTALERELEKREASRLYRVLRELHVAETDPGTRWVDERQLRQIEEDLKREGKALGPGAAERYVYVRFSEAIALSRKGNFERAHGLANALLLLEPRSRYADSLKQFRRFCDIRITHASFLRAEVIAERTSFSVGEKAALRLRLENVSPKQLTLHFGPETEGGRVIVPLECVVYDPMGRRTTATEHIEVPIEAEVPIASGAQWEMVIEIDTERFFADSDFFRFLTVSPWTQPNRIEGADFRTMKRIVFSPATLRIVSGRYASMTERPFESFLGLLESGNMNEIFSAAMLLEGEERFEALDRLIAVLEGSRADQPGLRTILPNMLYQLTDQRLGIEPKPWRDWYRTQRGEEKARK